MSVYGDYFDLYVVGTLADMNPGIMEPLGRATPAILTGVSLMMAVPSLVVALSPVRICRWSCIILGLFYTAIMAISLPGLEPFYKVLATIEMTLTLAITVVGIHWSQEVRGG